MSPGYGLKVLVVGIVLDLIHATQKASESPASGAQATQSRGIIADSDGLDIGACAAPGCTLQELASCKIR